MPQYIGFSTLGANLPKTTNAPTGNDGGTGNIVRQNTVGKKFRLVDEPLVIQDFVNALNIRQGQKVGQPGYGTTLWSFIFEPNTNDTQFKLQTEIQRVASLDPRLIVNSVIAFPQELGILIEVEIAVAPFNEAQVISLFADTNLSQILIQ
jgi:phage baseplate assembly protein W